MELHSSTGFALVETARNGAKPMRGSGNPGTCVASPVLKAQVDFHRNAGLRQCEGLRPQGGGYLARPQRLEGVAALTVKYLRPVAYLPLLKKC